MSRKYDTLQRQIKKRRERRRPMHWGDICKELGVLDKQGEPDTGLASLIAYGRKGKPYFPGEEVCRRLGLMVVCHTCKRVKRETKSKAVFVDKPIWVDFWEHLNKRQRDRVKQYAFEKLSNPNMSSQDDFLDYVFEEGKYRS